MPQMQLAPPKIAAAILATWAACGFTIEDQLQALTLMQLSLFERATRQAFGGPT